MKRVSLWAAAAGAKKYLDLIALGDRAGHAHTDRRHKTCAKCPAAVRIRLPVADVVLWHCGPALDPRSDYEGGPTCGCIIAVEMRWVRRWRRRLGLGRALERGRPSMPQDSEPAGKLLVASEACPRYLWPTVERVSPRAPRTP